MKRLCFITVTALLMTACAEDVEMNNSESKQITFCATESTASYYLEGEHYNAPATRNQDLTHGITTPFTSEDADANTNLVLITKDEAGINTTNESSGLSSYITRTAAESGSTLLYAGGTFKFSEYKNADMIFDDGVATVVTAATSNSATPPVYSTANVTTNKAWPKDATSTAYTFYAWNSAAGFSTTDGKSFAYDGTTTAPEAYGDLITAKTGAVNYSFAGPTLAFKHALAAVIITTDASFQGTITRIKFNDIYLTGSLTAGDANGFAATGSRTSKEYSGLTIADGSKTVFGGATTLMMVPQTHDASTILEIDVTDKTTTSVSHTLTVSLSGTWTAGHTYTYTISTNQIASISLNYPQWELSTNASTTTYGPVENYSVTTDDYGYIGMYVIDNNNNIVVENAKVKISDLGNHSATATLSDLQGNLNILSTSYSYYAYYPYTSSATTWVGATQDGAVWKVNAAGGTSATMAVDKSTSSEVLFANVVKNWAPAASQTGEPAIRANDLQISTSGSIDGDKKLTFTMTHKMTLAKFTLSTNSNVQKTRYYIAGPAAVADANYTWYDEIVSVANSSNFDDSAAKPYYQSSTSTYYYVAKSNSATATTISAKTTVSGGTNSTDSGTKTNAWSGSVPASSAANKYIDISPSAPSMAYITYSGYTLQVGDVYYSDGAVSRPSSKFTNKTAIGMLGYIAKDAFTEQSYGGGHALVVALKPESNNSRQWGAGSSGQGYTRYDMPNATNVYTTETMLNATTGYVVTHVCVPNAGFTLSTSNFPALYYGVQNGSTPYPTRSTGWFLPSISQWCKVIASPGVGGIAASNLSYGQKVNAGATAVTNINNALSAAGGTQTLQAGVNSGVYWTSNDHGSGGQDAVNLGFYNNYIDFGENGYGNYKYDSIQLWSMLAF